MPSALNGTTLTSEEFRDNLALRFGLTPAGLPTYCGCGRLNSVDHALNCHVGGLVDQRHDAYNAEWQYLNGVALKPSCIRDRPKLNNGRVSKTAGGTTGDVGPDLAGDTSSFGFWARGRTAVFDVRVVHTDSPSYLKKPADEVLAAAEKQKKRKYCAPCAESNLSFTPLVVSVDGLFAREHASANKRLSVLLAEKWRREVSDTTQFVRARLSFALCRSASRCLRANPDKRAVTPQVGWDSGEGLGLFR